MYQKTLDTDLEKGYVKSVTFSDTTPNRVWYLPHHPVTNPNKPGKVRRVSNAATTFKGNSMNSNLLTGPDLLNNLVGLLLRFREKPVAITADIEAMFKQVGIMETDQPSMRFPWPTERSIKQFQYTRLIFGARCSPTTAIFVLQKTANDFSPNQAVKDLVYNIFYMDDFVHSFETFQKAKDNTALLKKTLSKGGTAVLAWVKSTDKLNVYVSNRVREIQDNSSSDSWYHISGKNNPADHVSRGIDPDELPKLWLTPPSFLFEPKDSWNTILSAEKINVTKIQQPVKAIIDVERFSKWTKLLKATAQVFRFLDINKTKQKRALNCTDIEKSRNRLSKASQQTFFGTSICLLNQKKSFPTKNKLLQLSPFLQDIFLRDDDRTKRSTLCYNTKHPIILNAKEFITRLFLIKCHEICMHFGTEYIKNYVQQNFYVFGLRDALRSITYRCFDCRRFKGQGLQPAMADLPDIRFPRDQSPVVFANVGIDYNVPFTVIQRKKEEKAYMCLFNCLVTRAAHMEVTEDLTTTTFMTAIRRFIARRGQPRLSTNPQT
ncbi:uncharacterized protein LOC142345022 [Convolutriloba macropyga]|uniref:uncharacterized protein LOC142345022 n=1 Tax=Convolutriloba macropyga TaxID=536237 RepID=UPI003F52461F